MSTILDHHPEPGSPLDALATLPAAGDITGQLVLRRLWPRSRDHALLEYSYSDDPTARVVGQWLGDDERAAARAAATAAVTGPSTVVTVPGHGVVLHRQGGDRRLPTLHRAVGHPGATLVVHRPERRAVVCHEGEERRWVKLVPPGRLGPLLSGTRHLRPLGAAVPELVAVSDRHGTTVWRDLPGVPLADCLATPGSQASVAATGELVRRLHDIAPPPTVVHDASAEVAVLQRWMHHLQAWDPTTHRRMAPLILPTASAVMAGAAARPVVTVHRDLHDGQVLVSATAAGVLDPDTVAAGEAELDLGNLIAHLRLAAHQGRCTQDAAGSMTSTLLHSYGTSALDGSRLDAYTRIALLRLIAVHALRPVSRSGIWRLVTDLRTLGSVL